MVAVACESQPPEMRNDSPQNVVIPHRITSGWAAEMRMRLTPMAWEIAERLRSMGRLGDQLR